MRHDRHRSSFFRRLADRILAADPSLDGLRSGLRAVLTAAIAAGVFVPLTGWFGLAYELSLAGSVIPMMAVVALQDAGRRAQQATMAWMPVWASVALVVGTLVAPNPWLSGALFMVTIFNSFQMRRFGPRGAGLGTISYQAFFYALLFKNPPEDAAWLPMFVFIGCAIGFAVHFWLVPEHPGRVLHGEVRALRARVAVLLHDLARWLERDAPADRKRIDAHVTALNALALEIDARLDGFADADAGAPLRERVLGCELAAETIVDVARAYASDLDTRRALAVRVRELGALADACDATPDFDVDAWAAKLPFAPGADAAADARWRLSESARGLADAAPWRTALPALNDEREQQAEAGNASPSTAGQAKGWSDPITRRALQAVGGALGALVVGSAISPDHWYWAVFAAFIVFTRSGTVGQTLSGAWRQVLASLAGLCLGVLFAKIVQGNRDLELALLFVFIAIGFYAFKGMQNVYTVLLTAMLAMLYELMGMNGPQMLALRLAETATGAIGAVLAARFILPVRTGDESDRKGAALLQAAGRLLGATFRDGPRPPPWIAVRDLDRALQALREALGPVTGADYPAAKDDHRARLRRLSRIAHDVRHFYHLVVEHAPGLVRARDVQAHARALAPALDAVASALQAHAPHVAQAAQPGPSVADVTPLDAPSDRIDDADARPLRIACGWLDEANGTLRHVQGLPPRSA